TGLIVASCRAAVDGPTCANGSASVSSSSGGIAGAPPPAGSAMPPPGAADSPAQPLRATSRASAAPRPPRRRAGTLGDDRARAQLVEERGVVVERGASLLDRGVALCVVELERVERVAVGPLVR